MAGPKYVSDFKFPRSFGFEGSAGRVSVRPHTRKGYAKGGRVASPKGGLTLKKVAAGAAAAGAAAAAYDSLRDRQHKRQRLSVGETAAGGVRERRERELGLRHGGKVHKGMKNC